MCMCLCMCVCVFEAPLQIITALFLSTNPSLSLSLSDHLHRKFCSKKGMKMYSSEEEELWDNCLKKMNARIRYECTLVKKGKK